MAENEATTAEAPVAPLHRDERHSVDYAAQRIAQGLIGAEEPTEIPSDEPSAPSEQAEPEEAAEEVSADDTEVDETEASEASSEDSGDTETEEAKPELPSTLDELVQAFEADPEWANGIKVRAKIDGEEQEVTLAEAINGYQRSSDYTRKTTELSEQRAEFERAVEEAETELRSRAEKLSTLTQTLQKQWTGQEPDPALLDKDPVAYWKQKAAHDQRVKALQEADQERQRLSQQYQQQQQQALAKHLEAERQKMTTNWPELAKPDSPQVTAMKSYLTDKGFSSEEIAQIYDHRMIGVLMDALKANGVETASPQKKLQKPKPTKVVKPGAKGTGEDAKADRMQAARRNARRNPKNMDAHADRIRAILG